MENQQVAEAPAEQPPPDYTVPGLQRGLALLGLLGRERPSITIPEVSRELKIPRATTFRLVWTLVQEGFLVRGENAAGFKLGPKILALGFGYLQSQGVIEIARPMLEQLRDKIGASTHMAFLEGIEVLYVVRAPSHQRLSSNRYVGSRLGAYRSSLGRALLMDESPEEIALRFEGVPMLPTVEGTPTTPDALVRAIAEDRQCGYVSGRFIEGIMSVAAPVRDNSNRIVAAINISDYESLECFRDVDGRVKDAVIDMALEISRRLGYQGRHLTSVGG